MFICLFTASRGTSRDHLTCLGIRRSAALVRKEGDEDDGEVWIMPLVNECHENLDH